MHFYQTSTHLPICTYMKFYQDVIVSFLDTVQQSLTKSCKKAEEITREKHSGGR